MTYKGSLHYRLRCADYRRERYARDPAFRLRLVNNRRAQVGLPPLASVDEIETYAQCGKKRAAVASRNSSGRFV